MYPKNYYRFIALQKIYNTIIAFYQFTDIKAFKLRNHSPAFRMFCENKNENLCLGFI